MTRSGARWGERLAMSEDELLYSVIDLAKVLGLLVHRCRPAQTAKGYRTPIVGHKGFLDLVVAGSQGVLFRELKATDGRVSPEQREWLARLEQAGQDVEIWKPADWPTRIRTELEAIR